MTLTAVERQQLDQLLQFAQSELIKASADHAKQWPTSAAIDYLNGKASIAADLRKRLAKGD